MRAVDAIYDYYAEDLYDYCLTFLDLETAADALHDAMLVAVAWSGKLEARDQFGLWLFALTRNECLRVLRRGGGAPPAAGAHSADISFGPTYSTDDDGAHGVLREVYDLVHRHAFDVREIATVLGISTSRAQTLCERSEQLLAGGRHVITPARAGPRMPPPPDLRSRVLASANLPSRVAYRGDLAAPRLRNGYPVPLDRIDSYRRGRTAKASGAVAALLLVIGAAFMVPTTSRHNVVGLLGSSGPASDVVNSPAGGITATATPTAPAPSGTVSAPPTWAPLDQPTAGKPPAGKPAPRTGPISGVGGKCIEAVEGGGLSGGAVQLFRCTRAAGQRWTVATDGTLRTLGKCLHVSNGGTTDGTEIQLQACDGSGSQQWKHRTDGSLFNPQSKRCLEAPTLNASDTTQLVIWKCGKAANQLWSMPR